MQSINGVCGVGKMEDEITKEVKVMWNSGHTEHWMQQKEREREEPAERSSRYNGSHSSL